MYRPGPAGVQRPRPASAAAGDRAGGVAAVVAGAAGVPVRDHAVDVVLRVNLFQELDDRPGALYGDFFALTARA